MSRVAESGDAAPLPHLAAQRGGAAAAPFNARQFVLITIGAIAIFIGLRLLPTGTNLSHMDFRVDPKEGNVIEFCDPLNPQFIPVVAARSPVTMAIASGEPAVAGREVHATITLKTGSGKPVAPEDLLVTHTRPLHLLIVDPTLVDYQHVHPEPTGTPGEWSFAFTPRATGSYRVFGDFTPVATGRGLYASVDLEVGAVPGQKAATPVATAGRGGVAFTLTTAQQPVRAGQPIDLRFAMERADGGEVSLEPVMGAFAHLVAFDETRSGFAHLHPGETDLMQPPDAKHPVLNFKLTIPRGGRYVVWAQVNLGGTETFVPFDLAVME
jgi:hypothetical protein